MPEVQFWQAVGLSLLAYWTIVGKKVKWVLGISGVAAVGSGAAKLTVKLALRPFEPRATLGGVGGSRSRIPGEER